MAAPGGANQIARRVINDLIEFSRETSVDGYVSLFKSQQITEIRGFIDRMRKEANTARNLVGQLNALIVEMEALEDQGKVFDTLMDLRDDKEAARTKLQGSEVNVDSNDRDIYDARFNNKASLAEMIDNDKWKWHNERKDVFYELISIHVPSCSIHKDEAICRCNNGNSYIDNLKSNWDDYVLSMALFNKKEIMDIVRRLVFGALVYYIWKERNKRQLFNEKRSALTIADIISKNVKLKLMSLSVLNSFNGCLGQDMFLLFALSIRCLSLQTMAELSSSYIVVLLVQTFKWFLYGSILNILQGRNKLLEKIIWCVVDSGGVLELDPKVYLNDDDEKEEEDENNHSNGIVDKRGITSSILKAEEWVNFVKYTTTEEYKVKSVAAKMERSKSDYHHTMGRDHKKEIEPHEEPPRGILWLKGRVNKDEEFPDDEIRFVGDKLKETEDKIKEGTLKVDHGTDAMTVVLCKEKGGYARGVGSGVTYKSADEEGRTLAVGCENDAGIQKSNGLATLEKEMETRVTDNSVVSKKKTRSIRKISSSQNSQSQENVSPLLVLPQATPPSTIQMIDENKTAPKLPTKRKNLYVSCDAMQKQARKKSQKNLKVHEMIIKKYYEIVKAKGEIKSIALKSNKESSDEECLTFRSEDEEYAMAVRDFKKFFKKRGRFNLRAFVRCSWSDSGEKDDENAKDETCLIAQASNEICLGVNLEPDEWIKDSRCSKHMMGNRKLFSSYKAYNRGYSQNSKAFIILNKHTRKINESLNVTFNETLPPSKISPLVDDDLDEEEEAINVIEKS
nr:hypothetical protein [Tanacetum cinerariifolium]